MLRQVLARGRIDAVECSWKLDSSTASTSYGCGCSTASSTGVPALPTAAERSPAAASMAASIVTVVVLPLVPVTASHGAAPVAGRIRQASSTSLQTGTRAAAAPASTGWSGRQPGEVTTTSGACRSPRPPTSGSAATASGPSRTSAPRVSRMTARSRWSGPSAASRTTTRAPRSRRASAAAKPETPIPATTTRSPSQSAVDEISRSSFTGVTARPPGGWWTRSGRGMSLTDHPFRVEDAEAEPDEEPGDDPEPDDDRHLGPAGELEVVLQRRHPEHPPARQLERADLDDHGQRDDDEEPAEEHQQHLGAGGDGEAGERAAERERSGVTHEDLRRGRVPPEETEARPEHGGGHDGEVAGVPDLVELWPRPLQAGVVRLPDADEDVGAEDHDARAGRETVQPVGEVHAVAPGRDHDQRPEDEEDQPERRTGERQVDAGVPDERHPGRRRSAELPVLELQREQRERDGDGALPGQLRARPQTQAALPGDLEVVVEPPDQPEAAHEEQHEDRRHRRRPHGRGVRHQVPGEGGADDDGTAHRRGAALGVVPGRAVVADELAVAASDEELDVEPGAEQRADERDRGREEHRLHADPPAPASAATSSSRAVATASSPIDRDAFTSTTSPGSSSDRRSASAAAASGTQADSSPHDPSWLAPAWIARAPSPTATSRATSSRTASRPTASCSASAVSPSSSISPSTAQVRRRGPSSGRPMAASAFRAARTESGLALYASLTTVTPSRRVVTSIRHRLAGRAA